MKKITLIILLLILISGSNVFSQATYYRMWRGTGDAGSTEYIANSSNVSVSPILWEINLPGTNVINRIINRNSSYEFAFGDQGNISSTLVHANLEVYASKYTDLRNDIINNYIPTQQNTTHINKSKKGTNIFMHFLEAKRNCHFIEETFPIVI